MTAMSVRVLRQWRRAMRFILDRLPNPDLEDERELHRYFVERGVRRASVLRPDRWRRDVLDYVESMRVDGFRYRFAGSVQVPTLYSSAYACLIRSLLGDLQEMPQPDRQRWAGYFDSFQSADDGLFRDPVTSCDAFEKGDSWGARHLVVHLVAAYTALGARPRHRFRYLDAYKPGGSLADPDTWLGGLSPAGDVDNRIMNVVCALQYERDTWRDDAAEAALARIRRSLRERRNERTALWGVPPRNQVELSRSIQFAYHLYLPELYDGLEIAGASELVDAALRTEHVLGGYGARRNSSACEDIDSLDLLVRLSPAVVERTGDARASIERAIPWMLANQNEDGGFVFRRNEPLFYGHETMSSRKNESAMFPTWFRTLALAYAFESLGKANFTFFRCPGYQFPPQGGDGMMGGGRTK